jgi:hypothetical protein
MTRGSLLRAVAVGAVALVAASSARAQTLCTSGVTLKSFAPMDSLFLNSTATSFTIKLFNTVSGCPTEYRVSRFADFHDATWTAYSTTPSTVIQRTWFPAVVNGTTKITLYFQVRVKNPQGGFPTNINGGTQPMYYMSSILNHGIRLQYFG